MISNACSKVPFNGFVIMFGKSLGIIPACFKDLCEGQSTVSSSARPTSTSYGGGESFRVDAQVFQNTSDPFPNGGVGDGFVWFRVTYQQFATVCCPEWSSARDALP